jgi:type IV secretory pathway VirB10-like protein
LGLGKTTGRIIPRADQFKVVDKRSAQPMASGEQRAQPVDVNKPIRRFLPPKPKAPAPPPPLPVEAKDEEEDEDSTAPPARRLTAEQFAFEKRMEGAYKLANSKIAIKRAQGLADLRAGAIALGKKVPAGDLTRTKLKNIIEKNTPYIIGV